MTNLDRLAQLSDLRAAGALTDKEFEREKNKLLADKPTTSVRKWSWALAAIPLIGAVSLFAFPVMNPNEEAAAVSETVLAPSNVRTAQPSHTQAASAEEVSEKHSSGDELLRFATSTEVIGLNPSYLEKKLGIPREKSNGYLVFEVGGCRIDYWVQGSQVTSFSTNVDQQCQPVIQGTKITPQTTYAQLKKREPWGSYVASCLTSCGNAADPTIDLSYPGSRATAFIGVEYSASYTQVSGALDLWEKALKREQGIGEMDFPDDLDAFMCVANPPVNVASLLGKVKVTSVRVSNQVNEASC